ncbi:MAG: AGE family epimerase/isomerase, partial [Thermoguttaceae bacterium]|nr:AGE family epimerase/isomerase [Thermoguttaceae bacterium]
LLAYQLTGDDKYADMHKQVHDWAFSHFTDSEYGDWYGYLHRDGTISTTQKGNIFKGCFHLPRMLWECSKICKQMLEK